MKKSTTKKFDINNFVEEEAEDESKIKKNDLSTDNEEEDEDNTNQYNEEVLKMADFFDISNGKNLIITEKDKYIFKEMEKDLNFLHNNRKNIVVPKKIKTDLYQDDLNKDYYKNFTFAIMNQCQKINNNDINGKLLDTIQSSLNNGSVIETNELISKSLSKNRETNYEELIENERKKKALTFNSDYKRILNKRLKDNDELIKKSSINLNEDKYLDLSNKILGNKKNKKVNNDNDSDSTDTESINLFKGISLLSAQNSLLKSRQMEGNLFNKYSNNNNKKHEDKEKVIGKKGKNISLSTMFIKSSSDIQNAYNNFDKNTQLKGKMIMKSLNFKGDIVDKSILIDHYKNELLSEKKVKYVEKEEESNQN